MDPATDLPSLHHFCISVYWVGTQSPLIHLLNPEMKPVFYTTPLNHTHPVPLATPGGCVS